jgi:diguanylate cyclase (GGDEF)-like protein
MAGRSDGVICFRMNVQSPSGLLTEGVLLLDGPVLEEGLRDYGSARIVSSTQQFLDKIGVTLSGILLREELQRFSYEDSLTGLKNRRFFDELFAHESALAQRNGQPLSLLLIDIDHFKQFNDTYGHPAGDGVLRMVADLLRQQFRESDTVCRYGGEEFLVMMPQAPLAEAAERAEELRQSISRATCLEKGVDLGKITVSVGVASWPESTELMSNLIRQADQALYRAKAGGRDKVTSATPQSV